MRGRGGRSHCGAATADPTRNTQPTGPELEAGKEIDLTGISSKSGVPARPAAVSLRLQAPHNARIRARARGRLLVARLCAPRRVRGGVLLTSCAAESSPFARRDTRDLTLAGARRERRGQPVQPLPLADHNRAGARLRSRRPASRAKVCGVRFRPCEVLSLARPSSRVAGAPADHGELLRA